VFIIVTLFLKSTVLRVVTLYNSVSGHRCFGGTYRLHLQNRIVSQARNQQEAGVIVSVGFTVLNDITHQKTVMFILTSVRTSHSTNCPLPKRALSLTAWKELDSDLYESTHCTIFVNMFVSRCKPVASDLCQGGSELLS
jgi:hypothetical protein